MEHKTYDLIKLVIQIAFFGILFFASVTESKADIIDSGNCGEYGGSNIVWTFDDQGELSFTGTGPMQDYTIFDDSGTTRGNTPWYNYSIRSVHFSEGITTIGRYFFYNPVDFDVTTINLPSTMTSIEYGAFDSTNVKTINFPNQLINIGDYAFCSTDIEKVVLPSSVTNIGAGAFMYCSKLRDVVLPSSITEISHSVFWGDVLLSNISIPGNVTKTDRGAFLGCGISTITVPEGLTEIGSVTFAECSSLQSVTFLGNNKTISADTFDYCSNIKALYFDGFDINISGRIGSSNPVIYCYEYSDVDTWATEQGYNTCYLDDISIDDIRIFYLQSTIRVAVGNEASIPIEIFPNCNYSQIEWDSSNETIAIVEDGVVTALSPGEVIISATVGNRTAEIQVITYNELTSFDLSCQENWVIAKEPIQLSITNVEPENAGYKITWHSSNESIAKVNENGLVTTYKPGDVDITATSDNGIFRKCLLHVCYPVTAIEFAQPTYYCDLNGDIQLFANVTMRTQNCKNRLISFSSSDNDIATINEAGIVHGVSHGSVTVTAMSESGISATTEVQIHSYLTDTSVKPTCTDSGLTEGIHCEICGKVIIPQDIIAPTGHEWGDSTYTWNEHNRTVTAKRICEHNSAHIDSEIADTKLVINSPTDEEEGTATYTAIFSNDAFESQTATVVIPALNELSVLILPSNLISIEEGAFSNVLCQAIIIPDGCTTIGEYAFSECANLLYIKIPSSIENYPDNAFLGCNENIVIDWERD